MNFLQLVQRLHVKCRVSGIPPTTTDASQNAAANRLVAWTNEAWMDIQNERQDWAWMRTSASFPTVYGQPTYTFAEMGVTAFGNWDRDTFRVYRTAAGKNSEIFLDYIDYDYWRNTYQFSGFRDARTVPIQFTWLPDFSIGLGPTPIDGLTITGDFFKVATEMVANTDIPGLPEQFHMAIVYRAMMFYGASEAAAEVYQEGEAEFKRIMARIRRREIREMHMGAALA